MFSILSKRLLKKCLKTSKIFVVIHKRQCHTNNKHVAYLKIRHNGETWKSLKRQYIENQILKFDIGWLNPEIYKQLELETNIAIKKYGEIRSKRVGGSAINSKEVINKITVQGPNLRSKKNEFPTINSFGKSKEIIQFLQYITGDCTLGSSNYDAVSPAHINYTVGNIQHHGWHLDNAYYKLIICIDYDNCDNGENHSYVQYLKHNEKFKQKGLKEIKHTRLKNRINHVSNQYSDSINVNGNYNDIMNEYNCEIIFGDKKVPKSMIKTMQLCKYQAYFIEGRTTLHKITPFSLEKSERKTLLFSFGSEI